MLQLTIAISIGGVAICTITMMLAVRTLRNENATLTESLEKTTAKLKASSDQVDELLGVCRGWSKSYANLVDECQALQDLLRKSQADHESDKQFSQNLLHHVLDELTQHDDASWTRFDGGNGEPSFYKKFEPEQLEEMREKILPAPQFERIPDEILNLNSRSTAANLDR